MRRHLLVLLLVGCSTDEPHDPSEPVEFCDRPSIADGSLGRSFLLNHCTGCHSSENTSSERNAVSGKMNAAASSMFSYIDQVQEVQERRRRRRPGRTFPVNVER